MSDKFILTNSKHWRPNGPTECTEYKMNIWAPDAWGFIIIPPWHYSDNPTIFTKDYQLIMEIKRHLKEGLTP